ncbi:MAG: sel1 repeat family protein [Azonexus sp.]|jgi:TPR repeat protein|nr:sel1 repeat family protein [Azonexus sp.]
MKNSLTALIFALGFVASACAAEPSVSGLRAATIDDIHMRAEQGDGEAQFELGRRFEYGRGGVEQDPAQALEWYGKAAAQGVKGADYRHAVLRNEIEKFARELADVEKGDSPLVLAEYYEAGMGVKKDISKALELYGKAVARGNQYARFELNELAYRVIRAEPGGEYANVEASLRARAEQGDVDAQYLMGALMHAGGLNDPRVLKMGHEYREYKRDLVKRPCLRNDKQAFAEAAAWYRKAAEQGHVWAKNELANLYYNGCGVKKDLEQAAAWFRNSAEQGNVDGQYSLGLMYEHGLGVKRDVMQALYWYQAATAQERGDAFEAANQLAAAEHATAELTDLRLKDDAETQYWMGSRYLNLDRAQGPDRAQGIFWLRKAAEQGHAEAQNELRRLER